MVFIRAARHVCRALVSIGAACDCYGFHDIPFVIILASPVRTYDRRPAPRDHRRKAERYFDQEISVKSFRYSANGVKTLSVACRSGRAPDLIGLGTS
ncbi:hypothetical protein F5Y05DRAFT_274765 [Hypoxylon sp. FL0543]|nr:hypothetical protein F5Y05DRAFT_274765 [Hypoxylon sp. FL0543]